MVRVHQGSPEIQILIGGYLIITSFIQLFKFSILFLLDGCMPFMIFSGFFRSILAGEGDMKFPMMIAGLGTVLNIILDPIFIFELESYGGFGFGLGIAGAAMATVISQVIVFFVFIYMPSRIR